jgi:hypothetical protein
LTVPADGTTHEARIDELTDDGPILRLWLDAQEREQPLELLVADAVPFHARHIRGWVIAAGASWSSIA